MQKSTIFKFLGISAILTAMSMTAAAQTAITVASTSPAQGTTVSPAQMEQIIIKIDQPIQFRSLADDASFEAFVNGVRLVRENDNKAYTLTDWAVCVNNGSMRQPTGSSISGLDKNSLCLAYENVEPGTYQVEVAEGVILMGASFSSSPNAAFTAGPWTVEAGEVIPNPFSEGFAITPKDGASVSSLQTFHVTYDSKFVEGDFLGVQAENPAISLTNGGEPVETGDVTVTEDADGRGFTVSLANEITALGTYTLSIPEGLYKSVEGDYSSPAITATYVIKESPLANYTLSPESGSDITLTTVAQIVMTVQFTELGDAVLAGRDQSIPWTDITLSNGTDTYEASGSGMPSGFQIVFNNVGQIPSGSYTLKVPGGFWTTTTGDVSPRIEATYNVINPLSGTVAIEGDAAAVDVYDIAGRKVLRGADATAVRGLENGLYIINGKKVLISE